jgi:lipid-binding SYLF domain-containing protein
MTRRLSVVFCTVLFASMGFAADTAAHRAQSAATILDEIMAAPDKGIPEEVLGSAKCVVVVPTLLKGGFILGGAHGKGMATCRTAEGWSGAAPLTITGGSFGLQIGLQGVDLVMLIMNERGVNALSSSHFKIGADISAAAGPIGRHAEAATDYTLRSEALTYSRARGLFAGISINGAAIRQDEDSTRELYGREVPFRTILTGAVPIPRDGEVFVSAVRKAVGSETNASSAPRKNSAPVNPPATSSAPPQPAPVAAQPASGSAPASTVPVENQANPQPTATPPPTI